MINYATKWMNLTNTGLHKRGHIVDSIYIKIQIKQNEFIVTESRSWLTGNGAEGMLTTKGYKGTWRDDKNILYFYCGHGYMGVYICKNSYKI